MLFFGQQQLCNGCVEIVNIFCFLYTSCSSATHASSEVDTTSWLKMHEARVMQIPLQNTMIVAENIISASAWKLFALFFLEAHPKHLRFSHAVVA
jgi:hypothetical protein